MDKLERMFGHMGAMSQDELRALVRKNRADRRVKKAPSGSAKRAKVTADRAKTKARRVIAKTDADKELLAKLLRERLGG